MGIEQHEGGGMTITGRGDMPDGGLSFYTLLTAWQAMKIHVQSGGRMRLTRASLCGPKALAARLNQEYPDRPDGPFRGGTAKSLLKQIVAEVKRQQELRRASDPNFQNETLDRIMREAEEMEGK